MTARRVNLRQAVFYRLLFVQVFGHDSDCFQFGLCNSDLILNFRFPICR